MTKHPLLLLLLAIVLFSSACSDTDKNDHPFGDRYSETTVHSIPIDYYAQVTEENSYQLDSYRSLMLLWDSLHYTTDYWGNGHFEVPRAYLTDVTKNWSEIISTQVPIKTKKHLFFYCVTPLVLRANERILMDRYHLSKIKSSLDANETIASSEMIWLESLAALYKVDAQLPDTAKVVAALWERVDIVPTSLALAQAAIESGWGTSRFTREGNSIFGQWAWGKDAIRPKVQREGMGDYGIAKFGSLQESVCAYMLNINTHRAYQQLRMKRFKLKSKGQPISGVALSETLTKYSERGLDYVYDLKAMMRQNHLANTDQAFLSDQPEVFLKTSSVVN